MSSSDSMCLFMFLHVFVSGGRARRRGDEAPVRRNAAFKTNTDAFLPTPSQERSKGDKLGLDALIFPRWALVCFHGSLVTLDDRS